MNKLSKHMHAIRVTDASKRTVMEMLSTCLVVRVWMHITLEYCLTCKYEQLNKVDKAVRPWYIYIYTSCIYTFLREWGFNLKSEKSLV